MREASIAPIPRAPTRRAILAAAAALVAALPAVALPTTDARAEDWAATVAAAKGEGKVLFYNNLQPNGIEPLLQKFREAHPGIATEQIRLGSNALIERFDTEFNAGRHLADVMLTFPDERFEAGEKAGWMLAWTPPEAAAFPPETKARDRLFTIQQSREALIWNARLVKPADAPKEWEDLFDPKWKGKVGMNPPWRSVSIQQIIAYWEDIGIREPAERLKANGVRFFEGSGGIIQAVLRGDVRVAELSDLPLNPLLEDGAPIGFTYPKSGTTTSAGKIFVAGKAPHPNAGKVFVNWLMSADGQAALQTYGGLTVTRPGIKPLAKIPATSQLPKVVDGESVINPERQRRIVDGWRTVFGIQ